MTWVLFLFSAAPWLVALVAVFRSRSRASPLPTSNILDLEGEKAFFMQKKILYINFELWDYEYVNYHQREKWWILSARAVNIAASSQHWLRLHQIRGTTLHSVYTVYPCHGISLLIKLHPKFIPPMFAAPWRHQHFLQPGQSFSSLLCSLVYYRASNEGPRWLREVLQSQSAYLCFHV